MGKKTSAGDIPDKLYFPIREAARIIGVEPYVLRFWEKEFPMFRPTKQGAGHRRYRRKDLEMALTIKKLLYEQGFTIAGARNQLQKAGQANRSTSAPAKQVQSKLPLRDEAGTLLGRIRGELNEILTLLEKT
ncbi:MAG: MerR family transcriptional regulator [Acidobacteria bacterium]|nr:MerR family transcriptional regulator [Acidobacteriota bacterium]